MYKILRNFLFLFDAELIHEFSVKFIKLFFNIPLTKTIIRRFFVVNHHSLEKKLFGLTFKNPVGLAAGFDKNADSYREFSNFGFGFILKIYNSISEFNTISLLIGIFFLT